MDLKISHIVVDAAEDAIFLQEAFLDPLALQLSARTGARSADAELPQVMARKILDILEAFASRSHIDEPSEAGFTTALAFLALDAGAIPGFAPEGEEALKALRQALATDLERPMRASMPVDADPLALMAATLLAAARAMAPHGEGETGIFGTSSVLASRRAATEFVFTMHRRMLFDAMKPRLTEDDRLKIRMILDIVEGHLPPRQAPTLEERLSPEGFAELQTALHLGTTEMASRA